MREWSPMTSYERELVTGEVQMLSTASKREEGEENERRKEN